uniref:NADH:ubiquinone reductase (H(+)-translocating) n=1 Tax=Cladotaenia vulturi TaxID=1917734 RepID=A0A1J0I2Y9_9CEST|nr:NADH dehydrogenase subunit 5 [Cladotaenia vulturi]APC62890.1 NADH dehydrogenase subunit 5 [Cladotaenia vulturi]
MYSLFYLLAFTCLIIAFLLIFNLNFIFSFNILSYCGSIWYGLAVFDFITYSILLMLLLCFCYAHFYTIHYFESSLEGNNLNLLINIFVLIMAILVCTGDYLFTLIFWEYLGVISFFLILFYSNYLSLRSSIITLVSSRFGDICIFLLISMNLFIVNSIMLWIICFFLIVFTKSASFPFISWLLEAMRAPTPVSSLVHSSTLVAAGVWFSMRYCEIMNCINPIILVSLLILTIYITAICSFFFIDLKKIIALSTCNNISWCLIYLIFGDIILSIAQLVSHGVSKCMLFMLIGDIMSTSMGSQSSNCVYNSMLYGNWNIFSSFATICGLSGLPFIGVFFTKHFFITMFSNIINLPLFIIVFICISLSYLYSFRLCMILVQINCSLSFGKYFFFNSGLMVYFCLFINYILFLFMDEVYSLSIICSLFILILQISMLMIAYHFYNSDIISNLSSSLFGCDNLVELSYKLNNYILSTTSLLFYRWDNIVINYFNNLGNISFSNCNINFINVIMFGIFIILITLMLNC